jgi:OPA family glycerol-3-phosphate transporter-like MFS transporter
MSTPDTTKAVALAEESGQRTHNLRLWQFLTIALLVAGYAGYYLCRSDLSVTLPLISTDFVSRGMDPHVVQLRMGSMASLGVLAYALAKFLSGTFTDFFGGRRSFLIGMSGSVLFTFFFAAGASSLSWITLAWIANRGIQALGWAGLVKIASRWFSRKTYGTVMAVMSLSFLFGDAVARQFMAELIGAGFGWRQVFYIAAGTLLALFTVTFIFLKETPLAIGQPEPEINPANLYSKAGEAAVPSGLIALLRPALASGKFRLACLLSLGFTLVRETFNLWTPTYFTQVVGLSASAAASKSAVFPLFGGVSVLLAGFLSDRLGGVSRANIMFGGLIASAVALIYLATGDFAESPELPVVVVGLIAFLLIGPYSFLAGAIAMDFGGRQGSATASGIIDGVGYLGGVLAGDSIARLSIAYGWKGAFEALACVCLVSSVAAFFYRRRR